MENTNLKRLAAMCAAAASLSTLGLAGTAMAVETPTTADTATASITLNAAQGNTLAGHTFDFYRLGSYGDITANGDTDVKSLTVSKIDDASDKWIAAANTKAGITDLQGFDAAGDLAHVVESKVPDNMTSLVTVEFDMNITDGGKVSTSADTNKLISGQPTGDNKWTITVRNIDALTELPQTGGLLGNTMIGVVVIAMAGGVAYLTVQSKRRREAHTL